LRAARVRAADTLLLTAALGPEPVTLTAPPPRETLPAMPAPEVPLEEAPVGQSSLSLPSTVRVRVTGVATCSTTRPYSVQDVDFRDYVKHVLPNEWIPSWRPEALRAGAMAAKMYAWYWIARGGKWPDADVYDSTCDQVYNPAIAYASTNAAVDATWNWRLTRAGLLFGTYYRAYGHQCAAAGLAGNCLGQWDSQWQAQARGTWPQILADAYSGTALTAVLPFAQNHALRLAGSTSGSSSRVIVPLTAKGAAPEPPANVGDGDFTLELWLKAEPGTSAGAQVTCGAGEGWQTGRMVVDRDRRGLDRDYGLALAGGRVAFGVAGEGTGAVTLCGTASVADGAWHHVAAARRASDGHLWLWVDGQLQVEGDGPDGGIAYAGGAGGPCVMTGSAACAEDAYLVLGAGKGGAAGQASFAGWLDEFRLSRTLRYAETFAPAGYLLADAETVVLYHLDDEPAQGPCTGAVIDSSGASGGPSHGQCRRGSDGAPPEWAAAARWPWIHQVFGPLVGW
jgi:hypothetical protein